MQRRHLRHRHERCGERGVAAVEFAIILPLLIMVLFGIMGFGFFMAQSASLASGAREGARLGSVSGLGAVPTGHGCGDVVNKARAQAQTIGARPVQIDVQVRLVNSSGSAGPELCPTTPGVAAPTGGIPPCTDAAADAATEAKVRVTTTVTGAAFTIPVPGASIVTPDTITKQAEYRCEYH